MQSAETRIVECAEIAHYFEEFPLVGAAGQIGLIKEGKTGSFKVTSIINWSAQPKGLPGQGSTRKPLCCFAQPQGSQKTKNSVCLCCLEKETCRVLFFCTFSFNLFYYWSKCWRLEHCMIRSITEGIKIQDCQAASFLDRKQVVCFFLKKPKLKQKVRLHLSGRRL